MPQKPRRSSNWPDLENQAHREEVTDEAMPPTSFFDCAVVHLLTAATLRRLGEFYPEGSFELRRFRPNILLDVAQDGFVENSWIGRTLAIGREVRLAAIGPRGAEAIIVSCAAPQSDVTAGDRPRPLKKLRKRREPLRSAFH